jgi:membrane-bound inhibitor of C-type lysozyme
MQLVVSKRRNQVYLIVQQVEKHLEKQKVVVSLKIHDKTLHSRAVELVSGARIDLGEYVFDPREVVEPVTVELVQ